MASLAVGLYYEEKPDLRKANAPLVARLDNLAAEIEASKSAAVRDELAIERKAHEDLKRQYGELMVQSSQVASKLEQVETKLAVEKERADEAEAATKTSERTWADYSVKRYTAGVNTAKYLILSKYPKLDIEGINFTKPSFPPGYEEEDATPNDIWEFDEEADDAGFDAAMEGVVPSVGVAPGVEVAQAGVGEEELEKENEGVGES